jgi:hypothetical protein
MYKRTIRFVVILGSLICLTGGPARVQTNQERVPLLMSKMPPQQSVAYKALKVVADNPTVQALALTKTEIWAVAAENVAAVMQAAARHGVDARPLRERPAADGTKSGPTRGVIPEAAREPIDNWRQIFRLAPADIKMNDKQKQLIEIARASRSTVEVGVVQMQLAPVVEYALTKDAALQIPSHDLAKITIALGQSIVLTINRARVEIKAQMCIWHGRVEGTDAPATIIWWPDGKMAGSVQHQGRLYSIRHLGGEMHAVVAMSEERMPQEHAPMPARLRTNAPNLRDDPLINQGDASILRPATAKARTNSNEPIVKPSKEQSPAQPDSVIIDVIVAYTKKAASNYNDIEGELIDLSVEEGNESFRISGIDKVKLRLVHAYETNYVEEGAHFDHVWRFADRGDGYMEEIHLLRDKYKADVAILIVDDPKGCGLATRVHADAEEAFAVVHHECAASTYTLAHEIGHIIGARHELALDKTMTPFPYGHGYVNGQKWRDIMSYKDSCGGCRRIPVWSSPKVLIKGEPAGTAELDNARVIAEQAARVANFR